MSARSWSACLLLSLLLTLPPARAQVSRGRTSEEASRAALDRAGKSPDLRRVEQLVVELTNRFRREHGRGELRINPKLAKAAQEFAAYMAPEDKFSHTADGKEPWERTAAQGYEECLVAENIAWESNPRGLSTRSLAQALVKGWQNSPPHRKNLLDPDLTEIGVGVAYSKKTDRYYGVQDFGRPKSEAIDFRVTNETEEEVRYSVDGKDFSIKPRYTVTHHRCRPLELTFRLPQKTDAPAKKGEAFHPHGGTYYVVRKDPAGEYRVEEK